MGKRIRSLTGKFGILTIRQLWKEACCPRRLHRKHLLQTVWQTRLDELQGPPSLLYFWPSRWCVWSYRSCFPDYLGSLSHFQSKKIWVVVLTKSLSPAGSKIYLMWINNPRLSWGGGSPSGKHGISFPPFSPREFPFASRQDSSRQLVSQLPSPLTGIITYHAVTSNHYLFAQFYKQK